MRRRGLGTLGLLGTLALAPLLGGCGTDKPAAAAGPTAAGEPWVIVSAGSATPSPSPSRGTATPSAFPTGFLPLAVTPPAPMPSPSCDPAYPLALKINGATAVTGPTSGTVTWWNPGGDSLVEYRVTAIGQDLAAGEQRDVGWTVVTPGDSCGFLSATVTGLDRQTPYVFSVDAVTTLRERDGTYARTVARTLPVTTS